MFIHSFIHSGHFYSAPTSPPIDPIAVCQLMYLSSLNKYTHTHTHTPQQQITPHRIRPGHWGLGGFKRVSSAINSGSSISDVTRILFQSAAHQWLTATICSISSLAYNYYRRRGKIILFSRPGCPKNNCNLSKKPKGGKSSGTEEIIITRWRRSIHDIHQKLPTKIFSHKPKPFSMCVSLSVCLCLSVSLLILFFFLPLYRCFYSSVSVCLLVSLSVMASVCLCLSLCLSPSLSLSLSVSLLLSLLFCLSVCVYWCLFLFNSIFQFIDLSFL